MPAYCVTVLHRIELSANIEVTAKDEAAAEAKVQKMIDDDKIKVTWIDKNEHGFEEQDTTTEIEEVSDA